MCTCVCPLTCIARAISFLVDLKDVYNLSEPYIIIFPYIVCVYRVECCVCACDSPLALDLGSGYYRYMHVH